MAADILRMLSGLMLAGSIAILVMMIVRVPVRWAFGARLAYRAWLIVPLAMAASQLPRPPRAVRQVVEAAPTFTDEGVPYTYTDLSAGLDWTSIFLAAWLGGALIAGIFVVVRQYKVLGLIGPLEQAAQGWRARSSAVGPAVIGVLKSRIVVPADFEDRFSPEEQTAILAHEKAHLATHDVRINALVIAARCLFWFNPLFHLAGRMIRQDQELACDAKVISRQPDIRRAYAEALLKSQTNAAALPVGCFWPSKSQKRLRGRIVLLSRRSPGFLRRAAGLALISVLAFFTSVTAWANSAPHVRGSMKVAHSVTFTPAEAGAPPVRGGLGSLSVDMSFKAGLSRPAAAHDTQTKAAEPSPSASALANGQPPARPTVTSDPLGTDKLSVRCRLENGQLVNCTPQNGDPASRAAIWAEFVDRVWPQWPAFIASRGSAFNGMPPVVMIFTQDSIANFGLDTSPAPSEDRPAAAVSQIDRYLAVNGSLPSSITIGVRQANWLHAGLRVHCDIRGERLANCWGESFGYGEGEGEVPASVVARYEGRDVRDPTLQLPLFVRGLGEPTAVARAR